MVNLDLLANKAMIYASKVSEELPLEWTEDYERKWNIAEAGYGKGIEAFFMKMFQEINTNIGFDTVAIPCYIFTPLACVITACLCITIMVNKSEDITSQCIFYIKRVWIAWLVLGLLPSFMMIMWGFVCTVSGSW